MMDFAADHPVMTFMLLLVLMAAGMAGILHLGIWLGKQYFGKESKEKPKETSFGIVEGAVFGLFGLLLAFTFKGAVDRFQDRRKLIEEEVKAVGTAYSRMDLLPEPARSETKRLSRSYVDAQLAAYREGAHRDRLLKHLDEMDRIGEKLLDQVVAACREESGRPYSLLLIQGTDTMLESVFARRAAIYHHPPVVVFILLLLFAMGCSFLAGFSLSTIPKPSWTHIAAFTLPMAVTLVVILDLEMPRTGLIRVDTADQLLRDLRQGMN
jgi:hypothetical protein